MSDYGVRELVQAAIQHQARGAGKHEAVRYSAMRRAFGLHDGSSHDVLTSKDGLEHLLEDTIRAYNGVDSPFAGVLEAPPAFNRMARHHGPHVEAAAVELREVLLDLATDVAIALWAVPAGMRVTDDDLLLHGYDARDFPVDDDDW